MLCHPQGEEEARGRKANLLNTGCPYWASAAFICNTWILVLDLTPHAILGKSLLLWGKGLNPLYADCEVDWITSNTVVLIL
jgi:hypothetical protein